MTGAPKKPTTVKILEDRNAQLGRLLDAALAKVEHLEEELRLERYSQKIAARRASWGNGARQQ
jgi:hypothetical protein